MDAPAVKVCRHRQETRGLLCKRKTERVIVQLQSKQGIRFHSDLSVAAQASQLQDDEIEHCRLNKSGFRQLFRPKGACLWDHIDKSSEKLSKILFTPQVVKSDQSAVIA